MSDIKVIDLPSIPITQSPTNGNEFERPIENDFDLSHPRAFINLLPAFMRDRLLSIPEDLRDQEEEERLQYCFDGKPAPDTAYRLRISLWDEYDRVQRFRLRQIEITRVVYGICQHNYFIRRFVENQKLLLYISAPPVLYEVALREIHQLSLRQLKLAVTLPIIDDRGRPNVKLIEAQHKIFQHVDLRLKGAVVQKIDQRTVSVNVQADEKTKERILSSAQTRTLAEIDAEIFKLKEESRRLEAPSQVKVDLMKDVDPEPIIVPDQGKNT